MNLGYTKNHPYINYVYDKVISILEENDKPFLLLGHSHGGFICSCIAEKIQIQLKRTPTFFKYSIQNLYIRTMGSIYIPEKASVENINIKHYLYEGDVSFKCRIPQNIKNDDYIILRKPIIILKPKQDDWKTELIKGDWTIHNS